MGGIYCLIFFFLSSDLNGYIQGKKNYYKRKRKGFNFNVEIHLIENNGQYAKDR